MKTLRQHPLGLIAFIVIFLIALMGIYAPFLASSLPITVKYDGQWYFPLFRYLFYQGYYTKSIDLFYNIFMFIFPVILIVNLIYSRCFRVRVTLSLFLIGLNFLIFFYLIYFPIQSPAQFLSYPAANWSKELEKMKPYDKLIIVLQNWNGHQESRRLGIFEEKYLEQLVKRQRKNRTLPLVFKLEEEHRNNLVDQLTLHKDSASQEKLSNLREKAAWLDLETNKISFILMPFIRPYHWEDDVGSDQDFNKQLPWWELARINHKDLMAALIFGARISLSVGMIAVGLSLLIAIPIGAVAGYYGGRLDLYIYRFIEIWESMPTFFMLLMIIAFSQTKSIFMMMVIIGFFGWTGFSRFIRAEFFKQKELAYVEACQAIGFRDYYTIFFHILPNTIPPLLTLVPFAIMSAIATEAGLSFLGLGEEHSPSWGLLMDEGKTVFPGDSNLLWPPALLLTILLIAIALLGDAIRDIVDPKLN